MPMKTKTPSSLHNPVDGVFVWHCRCQIDFPLLILKNRKNCLLILLFFFKLHEYLTQTLLQTTDLNISSAITLYFLSWYVKRKTTNNVAYYSGHFFALPGGNRRAKEHSYGTDSRQSPRFWNN